MCLQEIRTLSADLSIQRVHGIDGVFSLSEMHKGVVSDLLHSLHCACNPMNTLLSRLELSHMLTSMTQM